MAIRTYRTSVKAWIVRQIVVFIFALLLGISILFHHVIVRLIDNSKESINQTAVLYMQKMDDELASMQRLLISTYIENQNISNILLSSDKNLVKMSQIALARELAKDLNVHKNFHGMFTGLTRDHEWIFVPVCSEPGDFLFARYLSSYLEKQRDSIPYGEWFIENINDTHVLLRVLKSGDSVSGAWMKMEGVSTDLEQYYNDTGTKVVIYSRENETISETGELEHELMNNYASAKKTSYSQIGGGNYTVSYLNSKLSGLQYYIYIPSKMLYFSIYILEVVVILCILMVLVFAFYLLKKINRRIIKPCLEIQQAMDEVEKEGNLILDADSFSEYVSMAQGFNNMKVQIYDLRIERYEQEVREQRIHMKYMFAQIQPHFFLNVLNVIYSFATIERYDLIQKMVLALVNYLRYIFNNGTRTVSIKSEIQHVTDFLTIQSMRYPDTFFFDKSIDEALLDKGILPFLLQTFIENSLKYGIIEGKNTCICLSIFSRQIQGEPYICISISDNGTGFSEQELADLNDDRIFDEDDSYKIGIRNTRQRLMLCYKDKAEILLSNKESGGASVEIRYPMTEVGEER